MCLVSLGFFLGTLASLGNLIDVWPLKLYFWLFGAMVMDLQISYSKISVELKSINIEGKHSFAGKANIL